MAWIISLLAAAAASAPGTGPISYRRRMLLTKAWRGNQDANAFSRQDRRAAIAANPEAGVALGGGMRKVRIPREGGGKSGGFRAIYVFGGTHMPIFLITVFAKNEKSNLSKAERAVAVDLSKRIIASYGEQNERI